MCGLFGAIGQKSNPNVIRALAVANRDRGTDSLGFFTNTGKLIKRAGDPLDCLCDEDFGAFIDGACRKGWFIAGHTRQATQGSVCKRNAHPFRYGRIIGAHNGIVDAPLRYRVDSQYLFDRLNKFEGDYQSAFAPIRGYWALSWFDGASFYLQAYGNEIALGKSGDVWYYSSDCRHLEACVRKLHDEELICAGATVRFDLSGAMERVEAFDGRALSGLRVDTEEEKWEGLEDWQRWEREERDKWFSTWDEYTRGF